MMFKVIALLAVLLTASAADTRPPKPSKVTAGAECGGELRVTVHLSKTVAESVVDKRDVDQPSLLFEVAYQLDGEEEEIRKEFTGVSTQGKGQYDAHLSGLRPGQKYSVRTRIGAQQAGGIQWGDYSNSVEANSGKIIAEDGPEGIGEGRDYCRTRMRRGTRAGFKAKKAKGRFPRYIYSRRRYYNYYYCSYSYYYSCSSASVGGIVAGAVVGVIFLVVAFIIFCKFYYYGGCGRPAYRSRRIITTTTTTLGTSVQPMAMTTAPAAIPVAQPVSSATTTGGADAYGTAPYPEKTDSGLYSSAMYPTPAPAPVAGYPNPAPYPTGNYPAAPPGYDAAVNYPKY